MSSTEEIIYFECMHPKGFAHSIRENYVDNDGFKRLVDAVRQLTIDSTGQSKLDRLMVASLFELPWEIENTVGHYRRADPNLGKLVSGMADELRGVIHELLWFGLEEFYQNAPQTPKP
jgi:hypothetical protein